MAQDSLEGLYGIWRTLMTKERKKKLGVETQKSFPMFGNLVCVFGVSTSWKKMSCLKLDKDWKVASLFQSFQVLWLVCLANVPRRPKLS